MNLGAVVALAVFLANVMASLGVYADARGRAEKKQPLAFFGPSLWGFLTLIGSFLVLGLYWLMHYSTLRHPTDFPE